MSDPNKFRILAVRRFIPRTPPDGEQHEATIRARWIDLPIPPYVGLYVALPTYPDPCEILDVAVNVNGVAIVTFYPLDWSIEDRAGGMSKEEDDEEWAKELEGWHEVDRLYQEGGLDLSEATYDFPDESVDPAVGPRRAIVSAVDAIMTYFEYDPDVRMPNGQTAFEFLETCIDGALDEIDAEM